MAHPLLGGRYQIIRQLGSGGFGQTFLAEDQHLPGKPFCVVKHLKPKANHPDLREAAQRLFEGEAAALYTLGHHAQIPRLTAHFQQESEFYLVQEFIQGTVLNQELQQRRTLTEVEVLDFLIEVLSVLEFIHQNQIIHRDVKPANLIRRQTDGKIIVIDFGAVKHLTQQPWLIDAPTMTVAVGSSGYSPPEQLAGKACFASDVYAVGMIGLQALTGIAPKALPIDTQTHEVRWRDRVTVSRGLADILDRMVRYDFRQRYQSVSAVLTDLQALNRATILANQSEDGSATWIQRGDGFFQRHSHREALAAYDAAIQCNPLNAIAWLKRGMTFDGLRQFGAALTCYDRATQLEPTNATIWSKRGLVLENLLRPEEALASYRKGVELDSQNYWAWYDQGKVLEHLGQVEVALNAYRRVLQIKPNFQLAIESTKRLLSQLRRLDELMSLGYYEEVLHVADGILKALPGDVSAWFAQAIALSKLKRYEAALTAFDLVVELDDSHQTAWLERGLVLTALGRPLEAIGSYEVMIQRESGHVRAWLERAITLEQLQQYDGAMLSYNQVMELDPSNRTALQGRERMIQCLQLQQHDELPTSDETTLCVAAGQPHRLPMAIGADEHVATLGHQTAPLDDQTAVLNDQATVLGVDTPATALHGLNGTKLRLPLLPMAAGFSSDRLLNNRMLEQLQHHPDAVAAYSHAIQLNPNDPEVFQWRGNLLVALGRYEEAIAAYDRAIQALPDNATLWCCLAGSLLKLSRYRESLDCFDRAIRLKPENHTPWYWRGKVLVELQRWAEAETSLGQVLQLKPDFPPAKRELQRLHQLRSTATAIAS
jgi:tetratricopeptide (TPR) repeat protein/tRNA A-37 threonylcarbamoyl transferase component Bud32